MKSSRTCWQQAALMGLLLSPLLALVSGCDRGPNPFADPPPPKAVEPALTTQVAEQQAPALQPEATVSAEAIWQHGMALLSESFKQAEHLQRLVQQLLDNPSEEALENARQQWLLTTRAYEAFYVYTRLGLVQPKAYARVRDHHANIAAWPVQPGYLDSFGEYERSGIVFDVDLPITEMKIRWQHGLTDAGDVALGLYALQFILFGERDDRDVADLKPELSLSEQQRADGYIHEKELPNNRRRQLAQLQAELISADLMQMGREWQAVQGDFSQLTQAEWVQMMLAAGLAMTTEQLLVLAEHSQAVVDEATGASWQSTQLAERLSVQLAGWQAILAMMPNAATEKLAAPTAFALSHLQQWATNGNQAALQQAHQAIRKLAGALQAATTPLRASVTVPAKPDKTEP